MLGIHSINRYHHRYAVLSADNELMMNFHHFEGPKPVPTKTDFCSY